MIDAQHQTDQVDALRVCYFGAYKRGEGNPRNTVLISALRQAGASVWECHVPLFRDDIEKTKMAAGALGTPRLAFRLVACLARLTWKFFHAPKTDLVIVGFGGAFDVVLARFLTWIRRQPVVYDPLISAYDTVVNDRKLSRPGSIKAKALWWYDYLCCRCADVVLLDTESHIDFFVEQFRMRRERFVRVWVGSDKETCGIKPASQDFTRSQIRVLFWGSYIPLHGIDTIVRAAQLVCDDDNIEFQIVGSGQTEKDVRAIAAEQPETRVQFLPRMGYREIAQRVCQADVCLGIFGTTDKTQRVIPCKVFESLFFGKPLVTGDTPAARELLHDGVDACLIPCGDPQALATCLRRLRTDKQQRQSIAAGARATYRECCTHQRIGNDLVDALQVKLMGR